MFEKKFMQLAVRLAEENVTAGKGGPFGAVIVRDGQVLAACANSVTPDADPTAHAEVNAIRAACRKLGRFSLEGCELYASCEPCPMCLGAVYWARLDRVYYASTSGDAAGAGFDDSFIYREIALEDGKRSIPFRQVDGKGREFRLWMEKQDREEY